MNTCIKCDEMDDYRLHLGYKECTDCSEKKIFIRTYPTRLVDMFNP